MNTSSTTTTRILALDPAGRHLGFAVMEGPTRLIDWGLRAMSGVEDLIGHYQPVVFVVEDLHSRRGARAQKQMARIEKYAADKGIPLKQFSRSEVRKALNLSTKREIAEAIAVSFPELAPRLPPVRKCWMSEDERINIFDAMAVALTYFSVGEKTEVTTAQPWEANYI